MKIVISITENICKENKIKYFFQLKHCFNFKGEVNPMGKPFGCYFKNKFYQTLFKSNFFLYKNYVRMDGCS